MIKVYLDWNCITHCKNTLSEFYELLMRYSNVFICPFGVAHLRDVQTKPDANPTEYQKDLDQLTDICGRNMLLCSGNEINLQNVTPRQYLDDAKSDLNFLQNKFIFPYAKVRKIFRMAFSKQDILKVSGETDSQKVFPLADDIVKRTIGCDIDSVVEKLFPSVEQTLELKIKQTYFVLDMLGYKTEDKRKSFANLDTDAHHIFLAYFCDYLVSDDEKMRDKAKVIYSHFQCTTKVMDSQSFMKEMPFIVEKCYDHDSIPEIMKINGFPEIQNNQNHYKALQYPLWGTFKYCLNASALDPAQPDNMAYFVTDNRFLFYDELEPLVRIVSLFLPESERDSFVEKYIQSFVYKHPLGDIQFTFDTPNYIYNCVLKTYEGQPILQVTYEIPS